MRKYSFFLLYFFLSFSIHGQTVFNSLESASPSFSDEEKKHLIMGNGLYFTRIVYANTQTAGWFYKGIGGLSENTSLTGC
jgi:hypothetical protein